MVLGASKSGHHRIQGDGRRHHGLARSSICAGPSAHRHDSDSRAVQFGGTGPSSGSRSRGYDSPGSMGHWSAESGSDGHLPTGAETHRLISEDPMTPWFGYHITSFTYPDV